MQLTRRYDGAFLLDESKEIKKQDRTQMNPNLTDERDREDSQRI